MSVLVEVAVPPGTGGGSLVEFVHEDGEVHSVVVPDGLVEGDYFQVELAAQPEEPPGLEVVVPSGLRPGDAFSVDDGTQEFEVIVPDGSGGGDLIIVHAPPAPPPTTQLAQEAPFAESKDSTTWYSAGPAAAPEKKGKGLQVRARLLCVLRHSCTRLSAAPAFRRAALAQHWRRPQPQPRALLQGQVPGELERRDVPHRRLVESSHRQRLCAPRPPAALFFLGGLSLTRRACVLAAGRRLAGRHVHGRACGHAPQILCGGGRHKMARAARTAAGPLVMMRRRPASVLVFSRRYRRVDVQHAIFSFLYSGRAKLATARRYKSSSARGSRLSSSQHRHISQPPRRFKIPTLVAGKINRRSAQG